MDYGIWSSGVRKWSGREEWGPSFYKVANGMKKIGAESLLQIFWSNVPVSCAKFYV